jgi:Ca-activated chloride channel homolog
MTFASAWALAGLVLLAPLVVLHLRDRRRPVREVPSLLVWRALERTASPGRRGLRLPSLPLALALQAAALILLVVALAEPRWTASRLPAAQVVVIDDSLWMSAPGRLAEAKRLATRIADGAPRGAPVRIVLAGATPSVLYRGGAPGAGAALAQVAASPAPADLRGALILAGALVGGEADRITLIRAPEDAAPVTRSGRGELRVLTAGRRLSDQGIFGAAARCGIGSADGCEVNATVRNSAATAVVDGYAAQVAGRPPLTGRLRIRAGASAQIVLSAVPGETVRLRLTRADAIAADNTAWVSVPAAGGLPDASIVTLVGTPARSLALAQALVSVPGVTLRLRTAATYRDSDARSSALVVLDGPRSAGALPPSPAVLVVAPRRSAGRATAAPIADTVVSGTDAASALLDGVDLAPLRIDRGAAGRLAPASWIAPVAWSPGGPLLAAGDDGRRRVALLAFEPSRSNLPRLAALPLLAANLVRWAAQWAPGSATAGAPMLVDATPGARTVTLSADGVVAQRARLRGAAAALTPPQPGLYTVTETGPGVSRSATVAVTAASAPAVVAATAPVDLRPGLGGPRAQAPRPLAFAFLIAAAVVLSLEWLYAARRRRVAVS